jgi:gliding motility-associated-like protein
MEGNEDGVDITTPNQNATEQMVSPQETNAEPTVNAKDNPENSINVVESEANNNVYLTKSTKNKEGVADETTLPKELYLGLPADKTQSKSVEKIDQLAVSSLGTNSAMFIYIQGNICNGSTFTMSVSNKLRTEWYVNDYKLPVISPIITHQFLETKDYRVVAYQSGRKVADTFIDLTRTKVRINHTDLGYGIEQVEVATPGKWYYNDILVSSESKFVYQSKDYPNGPYFVSTDRNGCLDTNRIKIKEQGGYFNIPQNAFTPNGDGKNDVYEIEIEGYESFSLLITDKNNKVVFSTTNPEIKWDGTYQSSGLPCEEETYFAIISYKLKDSNNKKVEYEKIHLTK